MELQLRSVLGSAVSDELLSKLKEESKGNAELALEIYFNKYEERAVKTEPTQFNIELNVADFQWTLTRVFSRLVVDHVVPHGLADIAGVEKNDVIVQIGVHDVNETNSHLFFDSLMRRTLPLPARMVLQRQKATIRAVEMNREPIIQPPIPPGLKGLQNTTKLITETINDREMTEEKALDMYLKTGLSANEVVNYYFSLKSKFLPDFRHIPGAEFQNERITAQLLENSKTKTLYGDFYSVCVQTRGSLGLTVENILERTIVVGVKPDGLAQSAGMKPNSWIVAINAQSVTHLTHKETLKELEIATRPLELDLLELKSKTLRYLRAQLTVCLERKPQYCTLSDIARAIELVSISLPYPTPFGVGTYVARSKFITTVALQENLAYLPNKNYATDAQILQLLEKWHTFRPCDFNSMHSVRLVIHILELVCQIEHPILWNKAVELLKRFGSEITDAALTLYIPLIARLSTSSNRVSRIAAIALIPLTIKRFELSDVNLQLKGLLDRMSTDSEVMVRNGLLSTLHELPDLTAGKFSLTLLQRFLCDSNEMIRTRSFDFFTQRLIRCKDSLDHLFHCQLIPILSAAATDTAFRVRVQVVENFPFYCQILGPMYHDVLMDQFNAFLSDRIALVRCRALEICPIFAKEIQSLDKISKMLLPAMCINIDHTSVLVRTALATAVGQVSLYLPGHLPETIIYQLFNDSHSSVQSATALSLSLIPHLPVSFLRQTFLDQLVLLSRTDGSWRERHQAVEAMCHVFTHQVGELTETDLMKCICMLQDRLWEDPVAIVRESTAQALASCYLFLPLDMIKTHWFHCLGSTCRDQMLACHSLLFVVKKMKSSSELHHQIAILICALVEKTKVANVLLSGLQVLEMIQGDDDEILIRSTLEKVVESTRDRQVKRETIRVLEMRFTHS